MFKNKEEIKSWLDSINVLNYKINDDLTVDVAGDVVLVNRKIPHEKGERKGFPFKWGRINGKFVCNNLGLETLRGCPRFVGRDFYINGNSLITELDGCPEYVGGNFSFQNSKIKNLIGSPRVVVGLYDCSFSSELTSLEGAPENVGMFNVQFCNLTNLDYFPKKIKENGYVFLSNNKLKSLKGITEVKNGEVHADFNELIDLEALVGMNLMKVSCNSNRLKFISKIGDLSVSDEFFVSKNSLNSLEGCPKNVKDLRCSNNIMLKSLKGCPLELNYIDGTDCDIKTLKDGPEIINTTIDLRGNYGIDVLNGFNVKRYEQIVLSKGIKFFDLLAQSSKSESFLILDSNNINVVKNYLNLKGNFIDEKKDKGNSIKPKI